MEILDSTSGDECGSDDSHYFLRIITTVSDTEGCGRNQLQAFEPMVGFIGIQVAEVKREYRHGQQDKGQQDPFEILGVENDLRDITIVMCFLGDHGGIELKVVCQEN